MRRGSGDGYALVCSRVDKRELTGVQDVSFAVVGVRAVNAVAVYRAADM